MLAWWGTNDLASGLRMEAEVITITGEGDAESDFRMTIRMGANMKLRLSTVGRTTRKRHKPSIFVHVALRRTTGGVVKVWSTHLATFGVDVHTTALTSSLQTKQDGHEPTVPTRKTSILCLEWLRRGWRSLEAACYEPKGIGSYTHDLNESVLFVYPWIGPHLQMKTGQTITRDSGRQRPQDIPKLCQALSSHRPECAGAAIELLTFTVMRHWFGEVVSSAPAVTGAMSEGL